MGWEDKAVASPSGCGSWASLLADRARRLADKAAFTFLGDVGQRTTLTYAALDERARAVGAELTARGSAGRPVLLLYPPGLDYVAAVFGSLYAGAVAVPAYPPTRHPRTLARLASIMSDSGAVAALTVATAVPKLAARLADLPVDARPQLIATDELSPAPVWTPPVLPGDTAALLQYTSGSTSAPKGVRLSAGNLLANVGLIRTMFRLSEDTRAVSWLPMFHDMGLIGSVLGSVACGGSMVLMSPQSFLREPFRWLSAVSGTRATASGGPDFAYEVCVERISDAQKATLDLSAWEVAYNGSEPVRGATLDRFAEAFAGCGFRKSSLLPCYGLAEASLIVSAGPAGTEFRRRPHPVTGAPVVGSGAPAPGQRLAVVDPDALTEVPAGVEGEIWVSGASVGAGYWGNREASAETFGATLVGEPDRRWLRTGDLGFLADGELFVTGRRKDLIVIRGRNLHPQDVEETSEAVSPALRPHGAAAFPVPGPDGERLVVVHEIRRDATVESPDAVAAGVLAAVAAEHGVTPYEVVLIRPASLPYTSSGKVARHACKADYREGRLAVLGRAGAPVRASASGADAVSVAAGSGDGSGSPAERLRASVAAVLERPVDGLPTDRPLVELGLDSIAGVRLHHRLEVELGLRLDLGDALSGTLDDLVAALPTGADLLATPGAPSTGLPTAAAGTAGVGTGAGVFPLADQQRAVEFVHQVAPESTAYVVAGAVDATGDLDPGALAGALAALVDRHPAVRTTVAVRDGGPVQQVAGTATADLRVADARAWPAEELRRRTEELVRDPFDLAAGPLLRLAAFRTGEREHRLVLALHHLIADLWSVRVLLAELAHLLQGEPLPPAPPGYPDFALDRQAALAGPRGTELADFWRAELAGAPTVVALPTRGVVSGPGGSVPVRVAPDVTARLAAVARDAGATTYDLLLTAFGVLLARHTGQPELLVGSPAHGRDAARWAGTAGLFVNTVPMRVTAPADRPFRELLRDTHRRTRAALRHADLPFVRLVEQLSAGREPGRLPLVQVLFTLHGDDLLAGLAVGAPGEWAGLELQAVPLPPPDPQVELSLTLALVRGELVGSLHHDTGRYDPAIAAGLAARLETLLAAVADDPDRAVGALPMLPAGERAALLADDTAAAYPTRAVHELIADRAARTPDAPALIDDLDPEILPPNPTATGPIAVDSTPPVGDPAAGGSTVGDSERGGVLTYAEVQRAADRLAHRLAAAGAGPGTLVALHLPRSATAIVAMLAVLRTGAAYLPIDPDLPPARIRYVLDDARVTAVVSDGSGLPPLDVPVLSSEGPGSDEPFPAVPAHPDAIAYVLYTSGSTGRPKGVVVPHGALVNFLTAMGRRFAPAPGDRLLAVTTLSFDISALEVFLPLLYGGTVQLAGQSVTADGAALRRRLDTGMIRFLQATPVTWQLLLDAGWTGTPGLTKLIGGEAVPIALARRLGSDLWNMYGPTETTIWSACTRLDPVGDATPIGRPIDNTRIHVLDPRLEPVPVGVDGEIWIAGDGLARGYLHRPGLTAERFLPDPHGPPGSRMYRTGDLGRWRSDGRLDYVSRIDDQVKVNGLRIELGEIEAILDRQRGVRRSAVVVAPGPTLIAFVQPDRPPSDAGAGGGVPDRRELRAALRQELPGYMVPARIVELAEFPLTANGKLERKALVVPAGGDEPDRDFVPPRGPTEQALAGMIAELLGRDRIGRTDNLFDLGGHSLLASRLVLRIREHFGVGVLLRQLFDEPSVERLAVLVEKVEKPVGPPAPEISRVDRSAYRGGRGRPGLRRPGAAAWPGIAGRWAVPGRPEAPNRPRSSENDD